MSHEDFQDKEEGDEEHLALERELWKELESRFSEGVDENELGIFLDRHQKTTVMRAGTAILWGSVAQVILRNRYCHRPKQDQPHLVMECVWMPRDSEESEIAPDGIKMGDGKILNSAESRAKTVAVLKYVLSETELDAFTLYQVAEENGYVRVRDAMNLHPPIA